MYDSGDCAWMLAKMITEKEYAKTRLKIGYTYLVSLISAPFMWFGTKIFGLVPTCLVYYLLMLLACFFVFMAGGKLYNFLAGDLRSTSEYMSYENSGRNYFIAMLLSVIGVWCLKNANHPIFWISMIASTVLMLAIVLDIDVKNSLEFGPDNGRYTFRLKVSLTEKYTSAELAQLYQLYR